MRAWAAPRPVLRLVTVLAVAASIVLAGPGVAGAGAGDGRGDGRPGAGGPARDAVTVSGYDDYQVDRTVDVVNRTDGNNLVFWFTAGRAMVDGSITIELPVRSWADPLRATGPAGFEGLGPLDPAASGDVGIRPTAERPGPGNPARYCDLGASYALPDGTAHAYVFELNVTNTDRVRRIEAAHLTCAAGQKIAIRIVGLTAPKTGLERFTVRVADVSGSRSVNDPMLVVKPTPAVRLTIDHLPDVMSYRATVIVTVTAVFPNGRRATGYRGTVRIYTDPWDCTIENKGYWQADLVRGQTQVALFGHQPGTYVMVFEDIDHRAQAYRDQFRVVDVPEAVQCPAYYH